MRWGIIGCGDVTEVKSGPAFQKAERSELVAVMRRNGALAADYAKRHGVPKWYDDAEQLIHDPDVDAVYIATPPHAHKDYTLKVAAAGKPVYVEKPMALNAQECREMVEACRSAGVPLFVAYYRRAQPRFLEIKRQLEAGAIGEVRFVETIFHRPPQANDTAQETPWRVKPDLSGGGYFMDLAPHTLDLLDDFLGPIEEVRGFARNQAGLYPAEDIVTGTFRFASGAQGTGAWCFSAATERDETRIVGSEGEIVFSTFGQDPIVLKTPRGEEQLTPPVPEHVQQPLIQSVVDELTGRGRCPSTGENGLRCAQVTDALLATYQGVPS